MIIYTISRFCLLSIHQSYHSLQQQTIRLPTRILSISSLKILTSVRPQFIPKIARKIRCQQISSVWLTTNCFITHTKAQPHHILLPPRNTLNCVWQTSEKSNGGQIRTRAKSLDNRCSLLSSWFKSALVVAVLSFRLTQGLICINSKLSNKNKHGLREERAL